MALACSLTMNIQAQETKNSNLKYPQTSKGDVTDSYFGSTVPDPYRWLEDDRSKETEAWVKEENAVTFAYLDQIPFRDAIKKRMEVLWNYDRVSSPFKEGDYT